ncbi:MAG: hypothetical protein M3456_07500 [Actinomycetota bacterium]|nr:hypothetical protein [Actinomycetota bacterium]
MRRNSKTAPQATLPIPLGLVASVVVLDGLYSRFAIRLLNSGVVAGKRSTAAR